MFIFVCLTYLFLLRSNISKTNDIFVRPNLFDLSTVTCIYSVARTRLYNCTSAATQSYLYLSYNYLITKTSLFTCTNLFYNASDTYTLQLTTINFPSGLPCSTSHIKVYSNFLRPFFLIFTSISPSFSSFLKLVFFICAIRPYHNTPSLFTNCSELFLVRFFLSIYIFFSFPNFFTSKLQ